MSQPILETERLTLRPFAASDAWDVQKLAGDERIAKGTDAVPHPYPLDAAHSWIAGHPAALQAFKEIVYAITVTEDRQLVGAISLLNLSLRDLRGELGFWVGVDYWSRGYCSEAARALISDAQSRYGISRIVGRCLTWNAASARVMDKLGMRQEGRLEKHVLRTGRCEDQVLYGLCLPGR